jgi:hypothetical protein
MAEDDLPEGNGTLIGCDSGSRLRAERERLEWALPRRA